METTRARNDNGARSLLKAQLDDIAVRLRREAEVPPTTFVGGNFLDVAQGVEQQEVARLSTSRLTERARRLRDALGRLSDGEYGVCAECGAPIPPRRLLAVPDATTCVACQVELERSVKTSE